MEILIKNINNKDIYVYRCIKCNGTFWSKDAYLNHWSCDQKIKCSKCYKEGHVISKCNAIEITKDNKMMYRKIYTKSNISVFEIESKNDKDFITIDIM